MEALWILQARKNASLRDLPRASGRKGTRKGWSLIDGTKGQGQRSSGGEGETADPDLHPHQPNTSRSPDQPCEVCVRARERACVCVWGVVDGKMGPRGLGRKEWIPAVQKTEVTSGPKYRACKPYGLGKEGHELLMYPCRVQGKADEKGG